MAPAVPFQNIVDNFDDNRIARIKEAAEKYQVKRNEANGIATETTTEETEEQPWD